MSERDGDDAGYIASMKQRTEELEQILEQFSDRLRRMRERNRRTQQEIESFQSELDELHTWLLDRLWPPRRLRGCAAALPDDVDGDLHRRARSQLAGT